MRVNLFWKRTGEGSTATKKWWQLVWDVVRAHPKETGVVNFVDFFLLKFNNKIAQRLFVAVFPSGYKDLS